jgi:serine/threonine protein kinase
VLYADVYSAQGDSTGQNVALKISRLARNDTSKDSYLHEVAALFQSSKLRSPLSGALPNIVDAGEAWIQGQGVGLGVIVMELMPGLTFGNHLQQKRCHDENQLIEIISTYAQHLATLERNGIIHSDPSVDNLIIKVNDADNSISCATIDLGRSSLPRISEKQINSTHQWARSSNNSQQKGLIHFENVLAKAIRYSIRMNFDNNFIGLLQNITDRAAGTAYPNIRSFSELAECLQIAKEHVNNGNFHQLENLFGTGANHHSPPEAGY